VISNVIKYAAAKTALALASETTALHLTTLAKSAALEALSAAQNALSAAQNALSAAQNASTSESVERTSESVKRTSVSYENTALIHDAVTDTFETIRILYTQAIQSCVSDDETMESERKDINAQIVQIQEHMAKVESKLSEVQSMNASLQQSESSIQTLDKHFDSSVQTHQHSSLQTLLYSMTGDQLTEFFEREHVKMKTYLEEAIALEKSVSEQDSNMETLLKDLTLLHDKPAQDRYVQRCMRHTSLELTVAAAKSIFTALTTAVYTQFTEFEFVAVINTAILTAIASNEAQKTEQKAEIHALTLSFDGINTRITKMIHDHRNSSIRTDAFSLIEKIKKVHELFNTHLKPTLTLCNAKTMNAETSNLLFQREQAYKVLGVV
jgi:hypothetical protein